MMKFILGRTPVLNWPVRNEGGRISRAWKCPELVGGGFS
jgi:hypothetical protein